MGHVMDDADAAGRFVASLRLDSEPRRGSDTKLAARLQRMEKLLRQTAVAFEQMTDENATLRAELSWLRERVERLETERCGAAAECSNDLDSRIRGDADEQSDALGLG
jgi:hypothetical protein